MASATTVRPRSSAGGFDPFRWVYRLLTSVRFALVQLAVVGVAAMLGVVFPQAPDPIRLNPPAYDTWIESRREMYGPVTGLMRQADLFEVFHSLWFNGLLIVLLVSVAVCTLNRFAPIWRSVRRPQRRVNDRDFETAHARAIFETPADAHAVEAVLRRKRFKVEPVAEREDARYFFADRFSWAQLATFATHLSLILFLAGGAVSKLAGFQTFIEIGEGATQPVFPVVHSNQMQVQNLDSIEGRDAAGNIIDYRTKVVVYQNGQELCAGEITVNGPLNCDGYRFHQSTYTPNGVALQVRDRRTGQVVYAEAPILSENTGTPSPHLIIRGPDGRTLIDDYFTMAPASQDTMAQIFALPENGRLYALSGALNSSLRDWQLNLYHVARRDDPADAEVRLTLKPGEQQTVNGYTYEFADLRANPYNVFTGLPGMERAALVQLAQDVRGTAFLDVVNMAAAEGTESRFQLEQGQPHAVGDYEYTFQGRREYTGVLVKRDPGSTFIWIATALMIAGLAMTFYLPRRRLWVKVTPERTYLAGIAERTAHLGEELTKLGEEIRRVGDKSGAPRPHRRT
jgi:cytochrome c biogenesis protein ResB